MKKLLFCLMATLLFVACDPNEPSTNKGKLDPNAKIMLRGVTNPASNGPQKAKITGLTPLEVVQKALTIRWTSHWAGNVYTETPFTIGRTFADTDYDYETPALLMNGRDIITEDGDMYKDFIYGYDVYITGLNRDTIACVPDSVINKARPLIEAAYNDSNYTECYRLFNEVFTFIPLSK